ncbi:hypothetical protein ACFO5K_10690 [Nocardia halotolerans]|uniref:Uncharacterized protein n=1 Tax=Nocardia halotolerans TaxID=1755878 RepID=A0ABV8VIB7_9NOCA
MIDTATARRAVGDWAGACAAAHVDVDVDLRALARTHGRELAARVRADLRHLAPDLLRWHLPRVAPDGLLRPGLTMMLARYDAGENANADDIFGESRSGGTGSVCLVVRTPPAWAAAGQRISLALWDSARPAAGPNLHPHPRPNRRFRLDLHPHLWDARKADQLRSRCGAGPLDPDAPRFPIRLPRGCAVDRWAAEAAILLRTETRHCGLVLVRCGARKRVVLDLNRAETDPARQSAHRADAEPSAIDGTVAAWQWVDRAGAEPSAIDGTVAAWQWAGRAGVELSAGDGTVAAGDRTGVVSPMTDTGSGPAVRIARQNLRGGVSALPVLPDAATWVLPDLELLRTDAITVDRLHPLVASALSPITAARGPADRANGQRSIATSAAPAVVECRGERHRIGLVDGVLAALDHGPAEIRREELLVALTGAPLPCLRAIDEAHRRPDCLAGVRERLDHGDIAGALAVVEGLLGPDAVLREGPLRDELEAAARQQTVYGLYRAGLPAPGRHHGTRVRRTRGKPRTR